ncbi:MAG TPA: DUF2381 family protein [Archangium sp.]|nr:DUF2381 family protein [Archangium sp.]
MLPASPSILVLVLLHAPAEPGPAPPPVPPCADVQRIELSRVSTTSFEVCVSPGLMTGFRFDAPVIVDVQDDVRFEGLMRTRQLLTLVPPPDMTPGERIRLTVRFEEDSARQSATFVLVGHRGSAVRQVEVYHDERTRESHQQETEQERAKNHQLRAENAALQARLAQSSGLRGLLFSGALGDTGIPAQQLFQTIAEQRSDHALMITRAVSYGSKNSVAVEVLLLNSGTVPWSAIGASLVSATGERLEVRIGQAGPIPPQESRRVFIEADTASGVPHGDLTLRLWGTDGREIILPKVTFP